MVGELPSGTLLREQTLARSLGVSRGPLREAIRQLEGRMLVQRKPNIGASVVELSRRDLQEIWIMREALEGVACGLAASHITDEELAELRRIVALHEQEITTGAPVGYGVSPETDFHFRIMRASRNQRLVQVICGDLHYLLKVYRYRLSTNSPQRAAQALEEHREILAALAKRDPALAEAAMRRHIQSSLANILNAASSTGKELDLNATPAVPSELLPAKAEKPASRAAAARR